jgi:Lon protease-like protein
MYLPMFPLGSVLFPTMVLPLHVFEPRYRQLTADVLAGSGDFGVVLISRGHEVGGGDQRTNVGCIAHVVQHATADDGRSALVTVGTERIKVLEWLPDDPYPRAIADRLPDTHEHGQELGDLDRRFRRLMELAARLGDVPGPPAFELHASCAIGTFQIAALGPFTTLDKQRVLETVSVERRIELVEELLFDTEELLHFRLSD